MITAVFWAVFFLVVRPSDWYRYYPQMLFGAILGTLCDLIGVATGQWNYLGPTTGGLSLWSDLGIAPAEAALFLWSGRRFSHRFNWLSWLFWPVGNTLGEWLLVRGHLIAYGHWRVSKALAFYLAFFIVLRLHQHFLNWLEGRS